jgi:hypothetical protein
MSYEALYSAVIGAAPTVLIGFVLEMRLSMRRMQWKQYPLYLRIIMSLILISNATSALLSLNALAFGSGLKSSFYAGVVAFLLFIGITGLTGMLYTSLDDVNSGRPRGQSAR